MTLQKLLVNHLNPTSPSQQGTVLILLALGSFALCPMAQAGPAPERQTLNPPAPGSFNTRDGQNALGGKLSGAGNSAFGAFSLFDNGPGNTNTGVGAFSLTLNTADDNTAVGAAALILNTTGSPNTAVGVAALANNHIAGNNNAVGAFALNNNDSDGAGTANLNTAVGAGALQNNIDGDSNTAVGAFALFSENATGGFPNGVSNNAIGRGALTSDTTGGFNEAFGVNALGDNTTSSENIAIGDDAMVHYTGPGTSAGGNTAVGGGALSALTTGTLNTALGFNAGSAVTGAESNNIYIGDAGVPGFSNVIAIGSNSATGTPYDVCFIGSSTTVIVMKGALLADGFATTDLGIAPSTGVIAPFVSSARFKENIKPMDKASEAIFALKPVTYRYKKEIDATRAPQLGLIAEDVAKVNPSLVSLDADGKPFSVNYRPVTAMLLNEFLKEHRRVQELEATVAQQRKDSEITAVRQQKQIEALTAGLQKVSAQLELSKPAPKTVKNPD